MTSFPDDTTPSTAPLRFEIAALTDKGMKRSGNEDAYGLFDLPRTDAAFVVADGMGGLQGGDIASSETVKVMEETLRARLEAGDTPAAAFNEAFRQANTRVYAIAQEVRSAAEAARQAEEDTSRRDYSKQAATPKATTPLMGATVVAGIIQGDTLTIAHAGDSRLYRLRNGELEPLTFDHSFVAERVRAGDITEAEARVSRFRNMITRAIGIDSSVQPEIQEQKLLPGDLLMACSDGLNTMIENEDISEILQTPGTAKQPITSELLASTLIEAANQRGGSDNITTIVVRVADPNSASSTPDAATAPKTVKSPTPTRTVESLTDRRPTNTSTSRPGVVDMDRSNNSRRRSTSPFVGFLATLGVAALGIIALLAASQEARTRAAFLLYPKPIASPTDAASPDDLLKNSIPVRDYTKLTYKPPVNFGTPVFSARGDLLSYSPKAGLFFVRDGAGKMAYFSPKGEVVRAIASFDAPPPQVDPIPRSRVFFTTDLQGNSYISYTAKKIIEKYDTEGRLLLTLKGLKRPEALAVDENGNIFVVDFGQIMKIEAVEQTEGTATPAPAKPKPASTP